MRAKLNEKHIQYAKGQIVKGATAKVLVADGKATEVSEEPVLKATMNENYAGLPAGKLLRGEMAEAMIAAGKASKVVPTASPGTAERKVRTFPAQITTS